MALDFEPGDDVQRYLVTNERSAATWKVFVRGPGGRERAARRVRAGDWLNEVRPLRAGEIAWDVGLGIMQPRGTVVVIRRPDAAEPVVLPHPGVWEDAE